MKTVRCAIYTRKSSEEGLEQDFNSLDAQREACAAYILSQASEGWSAVADRYDDGGISGGTLDRPALQRLLSDIATGRIDTVVVYKVDRLTRSLLDFSKLVERFDAAGTSFVSVTQSFNTTTSMGRLTLNMLLSFAQFEREVTAERIRDKIAASKSRGMWMGGTPPLGYVPDGRSLKVVDEHAAIVVRVFELYLELGNVRLVAERLGREGVVAPLRVRGGSGGTFGGIPFSRGQLYKLLSCPTYIGEVHHKGQVYPGLHQAIVERDTWDRVQARLADNLQGHRRGERAASPSLLAGKVADHQGEPLIATHASVGDKRYRYYVSRGLHEKTSSDGMRIPASELDAVVRGELAKLFADSLTLATTPWLSVDPADVANVVERCAQVPTRCRATVRVLVQQVRVMPDRIEIDCSTTAIANLLAVPLNVPADATVTLRAEIRLSRNGKAMRLVQDNGAPLSASHNHALIGLLIKARRWWAELRRGEVDVKRLAEREGVQAPYLTRVLRLAFLSPAVVDAILAGRQSAVATVTELTLGSGVDAAWPAQASRLMAPAS